MTRTLPLNPDEKIVCFDPGEATGIAVFYGGDLLSTDVLSVEDLMAALLATVDHERNALLADAWVVESFRLYADKAAALIGNAMIPAQVIGMIRLAAKELCIPVIFQSAAQAKGLCDNARLKAYGWTIRSRHAKDAARHGVYYLATKTSHSIASLGKGDDDGG